MYSKIAVISLVLFIVIAGCTQASQNNQQSTSTIKDSSQWTAETDDGILIKGNYFNAESTNAVLLVHMLGRSKGSWNSFAVQLQKKGYNVLAIDLRGHGESGGGNYASFSAKQWNATTNDIKAAVDFLKKQNLKISLVGASIGANLVLNYAVTDSSIQKIVLLSPGLDYRGVLTESTMQDFENRSVLIVASSEDSYAFNSSNTLFELASGEKEFRKFENRGHGTNMFENSDLSQLIISWLGS